MEKTEAIMLSAAKYGDNKLIANAYTRECGRMAFAVTIPAARNKASALPYCQPLFQNEIEYNGTSTPTGIHRAVQITPSLTYTTIPFDHAKTSVVMFLAEILTKTLTYAEKNHDMYDYIATSLRLLDSQDYKGLNFHIKFLTQLAKYMGFGPGNRYTERRPCFDLSRSIFVEDIPGAKHLISPPYGQIFSQMLDSDFIECDTIRLTGGSRSYMLEKILDYYRYHFETLDNIKSLEVLQQIFH